jgi:hypothetical protein
VTIYLNDISGWSNDNEKIIAYTNALANKLEIEYAYFLNGSIDRTQLYSEIKFHIVYWDKGILVENANPTNLNIYSDGSVVDPRFGINFYVRSKYGGDYRE